MCLDRVTGKALKPEGVGYKVYDMPDENGYIFLRGCPIKSGRWHLANGSSWNLVSYDYGFHIFTTLRAATRYLNSKTDARCVVKVKYKQAHTRGVQWKGCVVIAKKMMIVKRLYERKFDGKLYKYVTKKLP